MKTQFVNFGGGLFTGLFLFMLLSASVESEPPDLVANTTTDRVFKNEYVEVPLKEFFDDVARYNRKHVEVVGPTMPAESGNTPSRMFLYSVKTLERFFVDVKAFGRDAQIRPDQIAIRFYYGAYPLGKKVARENYSSLHTLFMVPNVWSVADQRFRDTDIRSLAAFVKKHGYGSNKEGIIKEYYLENMYERNNTAQAFMLDASALTYTGGYPVKKAGIFPFFPQETVPVINQGQLCPPNCPSNNLLDYVDSKPLEFPGDW